MLPLNSPRTTRKYRGHRNVLIIFHRNCLLTGINEGEVQITRFCICNYVSWIERATEITSAMPHCRQKPPSVSIRCIRKLRSITWAVTLLATPTRKAVCTQRFIIFALTNQCLCPSTPDVTSYRFGMLTRLAVSKPTQL